MNTLHNLADTFLTLWDSLAFRVCAIGLTVATVPAYFLSCAVEAIR